jgi:fumarate reductase flavoprotein subunit
MALSSEPNTVWVNKKGERFVDECICWNMFKAANAQLRQPGQVTYTLFDERIKRNIEEQGVIKGVGVIFIPPRTKLANLGALLESRAQDGTVTIAGSWDDIAKGIGAAPEVLKATITEYNHFCDQGHDEIFAKDRQYLEALRVPPYYAIAACPSFTTTLGGIKVNHRMEVINKNDEIIPGLYAGGDTVGGWESETYCGILSGSGLGFCLNSGRIAGESASKYIMESCSR